VNFAWQNPVTGLREQTKSASFPYRPAEVQALRQEATRRVWETVQLAPRPSSEVVPVPPQPCNEIQVYEQIRAGRVTAQMESDIDLIELMQAGWNQEDCQFAFCNHISGARMVTDEWPGYLKELLAQGPSDSVSEVIIYATRPAFVVKRSDPPPPIPEPPEPTAREMGLDDLELIHQEVSSFTRLEADDPAPRATALALIDIARSLRRLLGEFTPPEPQEFPVPHLDRHVPMTGPPILAGFEICTCTGDGLTADGAYCVCPAGQARKRAAAVASRPAKEPQ
jgi:hypothetical protein